MVRNYEKGPFRLRSISHEPKTQKGPRGQASLKTPQAFQALYQQSHLRFFRYIFGLVGGARQDGEDLTAKTYMRARKARQRFRGNEQAVLGWLLRIARILIIDSYRKGKSRAPSAISMTIFYSACTPRRTPHTKGGCVSSKM
jgi:DNA-directed RNA polymerase specialized sigma24 family protein